MVEKNEDYLELLNKLRNYIVDGELSNVRQSVDRLRSCFTTQENINIDNLLRQWTSASKEAGVTLTQDQANSHINIATRNLSSLYYSVLERLAQASRGIPEKAVVSKETLESYLELAKNGLPEHFRRELNDHPRKGVYVGHQRNSEHACKVEVFAGALGCSLGAARQLVKLREFIRLVLLLLNRCSEAVDALVGTPGRWNIGNVFVARIVTVARDLLRLFRARKPESGGSPAGVEETDETRSKILLDYGSVRLNTNLLLLAMALSRFLACTASTSAEDVKHTVIDMTAQLQHLADRFDQKSDSAVVLEGVEIPVGESLDEMLQKLVTTAAPRFCKRSKEVSV